MKIVIGSDHGAFELKNKIIKHLTDKKIEVKDIGVYNTDSSDYPDIAKVACEEFRKGGYEFGILCCGTGIGISIAANKMRGIRCALLSDVFSAEMAKAHNDANFIAFGGRINYRDRINDMIDKFISTQFAGERHSKRIDKITALENAECI